METKKQTEVRQKYGEIFVDNDIISIECTFCSWNMDQCEANLTETIWTEFTTHVEEHLSNEQYLQIMSDEVEMIKEENIKDESDEDSPDIIAIEPSNELLTSIQEEDFSDVSNSNFDENQSAEEVKTNVKLRQFGCKVCISTYKHKAHLMNHMRKVHKIFPSLQFEPLNDGKYHCTVCIEAVYDKAILLSNHIKNKHEKYYKKLLIIQQNELIEPEILKKKVSTFNNPDCPVKRKKTQYPKNFGISKDGLWHCPKCDVTRKTQQLIKFHFLESHMKNTTCHICGKQVTTHKSLKQHILRHTGEKQFKCQYCNKEFMSNSGYRSHVRIHKGDKRYKCDHCDKRFVQGSEKKIHEIRMHVKKHSIQCEVCGKGYYRPTDLIIHMRRHTGEKPSKCTICSKSFFDNRLLKDHMISHSNEKPFECKLCSSKFPRKKSLAAHILRHSSIKNYHCDLCGQSFTQNSGLYSHKKTTHNVLD